MSHLFEVVHENASLLLINKPAGLVCHPTKGDAFSSLVGRVRVYLGEGQGFHLINRLDRETSGLVMVAKDDIAAAAMRRRWELGEVKKSYVAVVEGWMDGDGCVDEPIGPDLASPVAIKGCVRPDGAKSSTYFSVKHRFERGGQGYSLLNVQPYSGRKHQIRIHLSHIGHPLVGDKLYGVDEQFYLRFVERRLTAEEWKLLKLPNHALHAERLEWAESGIEKAYRSEVNDDIVTFVREGKPAWDWVVLERGVPSVDDADDAVG